MEYSVRVAKEGHIKELLNIRNNKDLFTKYLKQQENKEVLLVVAEGNNTIFGFGLLKLKGSLCPKLSDLFVKEIYRGNGVGTALIKYQETIAKNKNYLEIFVSIDPIENPKMIKLITKLEYEKISEAYLRTAMFYNENGTTFHKTYTRIDLKKTLD